MKLLFLSQVFPDADAAVCGTFNLALCRALAKDHVVHVLSPRRWTDVLKRRLSGAGPVGAGSLLDGANVSAAYPTYWALPRVALHRTGAALARASQSSLQKQSPEFRPDAVLSYWAHPDGRAAIDLAREWNVPAVCIVGGSDVLLLPRTSRARRREIVKVLQESDAIVTVSEGLRQSCIELGAPPGRVHTIPQGIDRKLFYPGDQAEARQRLRIPQAVTAYLWVGRIVALKRLDVLLEALSLMHHSGRRVKLYVVGDGPGREKARAYAETLGLGASVDFVGPAAPQELAGWYSSADATVLCSDSEGLPNVLRESLACGTPFVATEVGSIREIASPESSRLVAPGDPHALAAAMQEILKPEYRIAAGRHQPRTWSTCAREIADLLDTLAGKRWAPGAGAAPPGVLQAEPALVDRASDRLPATHSTGASEMLETETEAEQTTGGDFMSELNRRLQTASRHDRSERWTS